MLSTNFIGFLQNRDFYHEAQAVPLADYTYEGYNPNIPADQPVLITIKWSLSVKQQNFRINDDYENLVVGTRQQVIFF